jgi:hypothetical protein
MARKAPTKVCPKCGKSSHARSIKCKHCGYAFSVKVAAAGKKSAASGEVLNSAISLLKAAGSFEKAKNVLNELETIKKL